jgi:peptide-methionine (S)-S-oxide reductase
MLLGRGGRLPPRRRRRRATSGYSGGHLDNPTYPQVCTDATGHAEAVLVAFDPDRVSFDDLLDTFFSIHDPTHIDRQGPDVGRQYRSAIFVFDEDQRRAARARIAEIDASGRFPRPVATKVETAGRFWPAEEYHQRYLEKNAGPFCR